MDELKSIGESSGAGGCTEQVVLGQGIEDARGPNQAAHGGRQRGAVDPHGDEGVPHVDVTQVVVVPLEKHTTHTTGHNKQHLTDCLDIHSNMEALGMKVTINIEGLANRSSDWLCTVSR